MSYTPEETAQLDKERVKKIAGLMTVVGAWVSQTGGVTGSLTLTKTFAHGQWAISVQETGPRSEWLLGI